VDVSQPVTSNDFTSAIQVAANAETAHFDNAYRLATAPAISVAGGLWFGRRRTFGIGGGVYLASRETSLEVDATIPHPFFFNQPRQVSGGQDSLEHHETAVTLLARFERPLSRRTRLAVFGGPAFAWVTQDLFELLRYSESYPYDTATFTGLTARSASGSAVGLNAGADVAYYFNPAIGGGAGGQYLGTTVSVPDSAGHDVDVKAGGFHISGGVRVRF
jgi:hypothetical protein